jgi:hypothetical protein
MEPSEERDPKRATQPSDHGGELARTQHAAPAPERAASGRSGETPDQRHHHGRLGGPLPQVPADLERPRDQLAPA